MPEVITEEYKDGMLVNTIVTPISEEQAYFKSLQQQSNDAIHRCRDNFDNWDNLNTTEKREALKDALVCLLNLYRGSFV